VSLGCGLFWFGFGGVFWGVVGSSLDCGIFLFGFGGGFTSESIEKLLVMLVSVAVFVRLLVKIAC
jgi:hypothetical protein